MNTNKKILLSVVAAVVVVLAGLGMGTMAKKRYGFSPVSSNTSGLTTATTTTAGMGNVISSGVYKTTPPTLTNGQFNPLQLDSSANLKVSIAGQSAGTLLTDGMANGTTTVNGADNFVWNSVTQVWDRQVGGVGGYYNATTVKTGMTDTMPQMLYSSGTSNLLDGQYSSPRLNTLAYQLNDMGTLLSGEDMTNNVIKVEQQMTGYTTTTNGTALAVISGASLIHNCSVPGVLNLKVDLYDALTVTGTPFKTITNYTSSTDYTLTFDRKLTTGLTVVTSGATQTFSLLCTTR